LTIVCLYSDHNGCDYHRVLLPMQYLPLQMGDQIKVINYNALITDDRVFACDVLFFSRTCLYGLDKVLALKEKYGFKLVVDIDDYHQLYYHHYLYQYWQQKDMSNKIIAFCRAADLVFVTNEQLYNVYREFNSHVHILPNALPFDDVEPFISKRTPSIKTRFMYIAGSSHLADLKLLNGLFRRLDTDQDFKHKAEFVLCGYNNPTPVKNIWDQMEAICRIGGAYTRRETLPLDNYLEHYNYGDVAIAPLEDNLFNTCKSNLKYIEAGLMKAPFICTDVLPYTVDKEAKGIKFCKNTSEWYAAFKFFANNKAAVEDYGQANYEYVKRMYNLVEVNKLRYNLFKSLT